MEFGKLHPLREATELRCVRDCCLTAEVTLSPVRPPQTVWHREERPQLEPGDLMLSLAPPFPPCETLGLSSPVSGPQLLHLYNGAGAWGLILDDPFLLKSKTMLNSKFGSLRGNLHSL